ncbi:SHD1 domain-containing protein [Planctomycetes bacterium SV_7m_r]|uniref:SHD1 domain-containing protein n=1 Tax=Stieleria bergensis TaxID=2528025 RepID=UPI0011A139E8
MRTCIILLCLCFVNSAFGQQLEYRWKPGQKFSYDVKIVVDAVDEVVTYQGMTHYTVVTLGPDQSTVTYRGGLTESKRQKNAGGNRVPFGPPGFGGPPSPFSRPTFAGKTQTSNKITITTRGEVLAMEGDSQLPYLLGNVSLLPFELLPDGPKRTWEDDSGIAITKREQSNSPFGSFGPRGAFGPFGQDNKESVQTAGERSTYQLGKRTGKLALVNKSYQLSTPKSNENRTYLIQGKGTWTFDCDENVPQSSSMQMVLSVASGNQTNRIPIAIQYSRVSAEILAEMKADADKRAAEAARMAAEKKAFAEKPLTAAEKAKTLAALETGMEVQRVEVLNQLALKTPADRDPEIVAAISKLINHPQKGTAIAADKALRQWSPDYAKRMKLAKSYQGPSPVGSTGLVVESTTPLYVGQLVQAQRPRRGSFWRAARVKELLADGQVKLAFLTWGKENDRDTVAVSRRMIQLAPPELAQPAAPAVLPAANPANAAMRTWSDVTGRFKIQAEFDSLEDGKVRLRRADGKLLAPLPLEKLSAADRAFVEQQQAEDDNPFRVE